MTRERGDQVHTVISSILT